jgi:hypothetical protein
MRLRFVEGVQGIVLKILLCVKSQCSVSKDVEMVETLLSSSCYQTYMHKILSFITPW